jgi:hypothetical protein
VEASCDSEYREVNMLIREGMMDIMVEEIQTWIDDNNLGAEPAKKLMAIVDRMYESFDTMKEELEDANTAARSNKDNADRVKSLVGSITEFAEWHRDGYNSLEDDARSLTGRVLWGNVVENIQERSIGVLSLPGLFASENEL